MRLVQLTPGAGPMLCGNCFRDNALVAALRQLGHDALLAPLYLPLTLDEPDQSAGTPVFFGGINVYLDQESSLFRGAPGWLRRVLDSPRLLRWAAGRAARTRPQDLGELTLSMLQGEAGRQARELDELCAWLKTQPRPDAIFLSNALLMGLVRRLRGAVGAPVISMLQGEDTFLDALPEPHRAACWQTLAQRAAEADLCVAPSRYFADLMRQRLGLPTERVRVVYNGIRLEGYDPGPEAKAFQEGHGRDARATESGLGILPKPDGPEARATEPPVLGFFARMCREKGLDLLVDAYLLLRQRGRAGRLKLRLGGSCGPADAPLVESLRGRLESAGLAGDVEFCPNLDRAQKCAFYRSLSLLSVPARYGEAFGLYVIEALAAGVPVVQPRLGAFPELIEATGGGVLCQPDDALSLAEALEGLLLDPARARALGEHGRQTVREKFSAERMARGMVAVVGERG
jgi:glycosyltransferase involved in cell wall biosynthesis